MAAIACSFLVGAPAFVAAEPGQIALDIAKTNRRVIAFGTATTEKVRVSLFKERGDKLLGSKGVRVEDGSYRTGFDRPLNGTCRVEVSNAHDRAEETFPCFIPEFGTGTAVLTSPTSSVEIDALIAETDAQRQYGLMYRPRMRDDLGMAFLWTNDTSGGFWMKDTLIPLSIAFFDSNGTILRIMDMEPCTEEQERSAQGCPTYSPGEGVNYRGALEVNRGAFDEWRITEGSDIEVTKDP